MFNFFKPEPTFDEVASPLQRQIRKSMREAAIDCMNNMRVAIDDRNPEEAQQWSNLARDCENLAVFMPIAVGRGE